MKFIFLVVLIVIYIQSKSQCTKEDVERLRKVAFVIGESNYSSVNLPRLNNSLHDAVDIRDALIRLNFTVEIDTNSNYNEINKHFKKWISEITFSDLALLYFSGHGGEMNGINYIYPIDAIIDNKQGFKNTTYSVNKLIDQMESSNRKVNIIILDACRTLPVLKSASKRNLDIQSSFTGIDLYKEHNNN